MDLQCSVCDRVFEYGIESSFIWTYHKDDSESVFGVDTLITCSKCVLTKHSVDNIPKCLVCDCEVTTCSYVANNTLTECSHCLDLPFTYFSNHVHKTLCSHTCYEAYENRVFKNDNLFIECVCSWCGKMEKNMSRCSKCKKSRYCDRDCQKLDWSKHRLVCK